MNEYCIQLEAMATIFEVVWPGCWIGLLIFIKLCLVKEATWSQYLVAHNQQIVRTKYWSQLVFVHPQTLSTEVFLQRKVADFPLYLNASRDGAVWFLRRCCECERGEVRKRSFYRVVVLSGELVEKVVCCDAGFEEPDRQVLYICVLNIMHFQTRLTASYNHNLFSVQNISKMS